MIQSSFIPEPNHGADSCKVSQSELKALLWKTCDTLCGTIDHSKYKNYILVMLFLKYISDVWADDDAQLKQQGDDEECIRHQLQYEHFVLPEGCDYYALYDQRNAVNIGEIINIAIEAIEVANKEKLQGIFRNIDFTSEAALGPTKQRNEQLKHLLEDFHDLQLDMRPSRIGVEDVIGNAYEYLIDRFASDAGKKAGEFYTPAGVSLLLAHLLDPQPGERICDLARGSGSLLIKCAQQLGRADYAVYSQEANGATWALFMMKMFLHNVSAIRNNIKCGDPLRAPHLNAVSGMLMRFNVVMANPPFSLDNWGAESAAADRFGRFHRGVPPASKGDYAFISHMIETTCLDPSQHGRIGVVVPHGVLFRGGTEGRVRHQLIEENLLDAVIGLPKDLFYGTGIPAAIMIFRGDRHDTNVLFIDASRDYRKGRNQNYLRDEDQAKIVNGYRLRQNTAKYAYLATREEIVRNNYNLNISRYIDRFEGEEWIDLPTVNSKIMAVRAQLDNLKEEMQAYLEDIATNQ